jgi:hypothetical protein
MRTSLKVTKKIKTVHIASPRAMTQRQRGERGFPVGKSKGIKNNGKMSKSQFQELNQSAIRRGMGVTGGGPIKLFK